MNFHKRALLAFLIISPATAQVTLFEDDFTSGFANWDPSWTSIDFSGGWQAIEESHPCVQVSNPTAGTGMMARMGNNEDCSFDRIDVWLTHSLGLASSISIPTYADQPTLTFDSYTDSELCNGWDDHFIYITAGSAYTLLGTDCNYLREWHTNSFDLSLWKGQDVHIVFAFGAWDSAANDGLGWLVDNVRITTGDCLAENYCVAAPNSVSATGAVMGHLGSKRIHLNDFSLTVNDAPPGQFAHFFYGPYADQVPIAGGYLCVGTDSGGFRRLHPGGQIDANGYYEQRVDLAMPAGLHAAILPGTNLKFQCWYRDFEAGVSTSNFSDGLSVTFCE